MNKEFLRSSCLQTTPKETKGYSWPERDLLKKSSDSWNNKSFPSLNPKPPAGDAAELHIPMC